MFQRDLERYESLSLQSRGATVAETNWAATLLARDSRIGCRDDFEHFFRRLCPDETLANEVAAGDTCELLQ